MKRSPFLLLLLAACAGHDTTPGGGPPPVDSGAKNPVATATPVPAVAPGPDTLTPSLIAGRKKHDSLAFASTVSFGRKMAAKWPEPPTPLAGSILPAKRIVAFYGNPLSKRMGVL